MLKLAALQVEKMSGQSYYVLVASIQDQASVTMSRYLRDKKEFSVAHRFTATEETLYSFLFENIKLHISDKNMLFMENLDDLYPEAKAFVFLSKHKSDSSIPTLTCHSTGNYSANPFGGNPKQIAIAWPYLQKEYMRTITLHRSAVQGYDIVIEATHHGPTSLKKPVLFVELGSSEKQWQDDKAAHFVCDSLLSVLQKNGFSRCSKVCIGLGGTHYPSKFNQLLIGSEFGFAAIAPKHNLESVDEYMLSQMISKSVEKVTHIAIDRKGLGNQKERIMELVKSTGLEIMVV
jgi:D-aminoacyl-tRNA deacylase